MLAIVLIIIVPLPPFLLDTPLLAFNILAAAMVLIVSITIKDPLEFAAFAPALLVATLLPISSLDDLGDQLILLHGDVQPVEDGVGHLIPTFGSMVVGNNLVVGLVVFAILITIQFIVIAQGLSQRVAEVAARFTLDAMPGKQMAIDADVHAGVARPRGRASAAPAGAEESRFLRRHGRGRKVRKRRRGRRAGDRCPATSWPGSSSASPIHQMAPGDALSTFAILSIGNAMATTIPAFLMSISMGMMQTRVAAADSLGERPRRGSCCSAWRCCARSACSRSC